MEAIIQYQCIEPGRPPCGKMAAGFLKTDLVVTGSSTVTPDICSSRPGLFTLLLGSRARRSSGFTYRPNVLTSPFT